MDICDFCSSPEVAGRFECRNFDAPSKNAGVMYPDAKTNTSTNLVLVSKDYWAACRICAALVEAGDLDKLVNYVLDEFERQDGYPHPQRARLEKHLRMTYRLFLENREGEFVQGQGTKFLIE
jgi:hypothetical protein